MLIYYYVSQHFTMLHHFLSFHFAFYSFYSETWTNVFSNILILSLNFNLNNYRVFF